MGLGGAVPSKAPSELRSRADDRHRIRYLDGLRGIAIGGVIAFHLFFLQYAAFVPYGGRYAWLWPVHYGWAGVELFFLISGFVILMTLEKCQSFGEFLLRRWVRLFPAMLAASLLIYAYDRTIHAGPLVDRSLVDLIPGISFLSPSLIHAVTRVQLQSMDGPFWSLYVEVAFYVVFAAAFFWRGWKRAIGAVGLLYALTVVGRALFTHPGSLLWRVDSAMQWLGFTHFGWFAAGALFYKAGEDRRLYWVAVPVAALAAILTRNNGLASFGDTAAVIVVVTFFVAAQVTPWLQAVLSSRALVFLGFISYPLYLIHANMGIGLTQVVGRYAHVHSASATVIPLAIILALAWVIAKHVEPRMKRLVFPHPHIARGMAPRVRPPLSPSRGLRRADRLR